MEIAFYRFLMRAQELGKLKAGRDIHETARFLVATRHGFYVLAKTATDLKVMEDTAKVQFPLFLVDSIREIGCHRGGAKKFLTDRSQIMYDDFGGGTP